MNDEERRKSAVHEVRNAMTPLMTSVEVLRIQGADEKTLDLMERQILKLSDLVERLVIGPLP